MNIALDYDNTFSADPSFWSQVAALAKAAGHDIRIVTARDDRFDRTFAMLQAETVMRVIYTRGAAKRWFVEQFVPDFPVQVWIDDKPEAILGNSPTSREDLAAWRQTREDGIHLGDRTCG